ncbi:MAG: branched-chain amino acid ABC transporter permease [Nitrospirae bacterium]|nr:branched-chain amino acid ABC transporter permease [Nitrospirota bacterium]
MLLQQLINGITLGAVYALIALGYTMVYGILELINFAHGEIYMLGAYVAIVTLSFLTFSGLTAKSLLLSLLIAGIVSMIYCGAYGLTLEKVAYRPLRHAPRLSPLISAIGMSIFLQNYVMLTQGSADKIFPHIFPADSITMGNATLTYLQGFIIVTSVILMLALQAFTKKTRLGKAMRATAQDKKMASLVGIDINTVIVVTFITGSVLAAAAGIMVAMYYGLINFYMGYVAGIKAFTAAVLGGIGNIQGAVMGGFLLGILESLGAAYISSEYKDAFAFIVLILILILKPTGLLGERVPEKV